MSKRLPIVLAKAALIGVAIASVVALAEQFVLPSIPLIASEQVLSQSTAVVPSQHVRFTIYPEGILPATATVHKGLISILIEDLAGAESGVLVERLGDGGPVVVGTVRRFEQHWRGRSSIELSPGTYRLRIANDQAKEALLTVEP